MNKKIDNKNTRKFLKMLTAGLALTCVGFAINAKAEDKTDYAFVVTSDPQYPWTPKLDDGDNSESEDETKSVSSSLIHNQYNSINDYSFSIGNKVINTVINGDVTAYGHDWQWGYMRDAMATLNSPVSFGLGNHDIENNFGDTTFNISWINSFNALYAFNPQHLISKDTNTEDYVGNLKFTGSLDYSQKIGDFRMIMANNYPTMTNSTSMPEPLVPIPTTQYTYWLTPGMDYIEEQLAQAQEKNQPAILYIHKPNDWKWDSNTSGSFKAMIEKYYNNGTLRAIFTGHYHKTVGKVNVGNGTADYSQYFGNVPVYSSGSASQKTYLTAEVDQSNNEMRIYEVLGNVWENKTLIDTIAIHNNGLNNDDQSTIKDEQQAISDSLGTDNIKITSMRNTRVLDDSHASDDLIYYGDNGGKNQRWRFEYSYDRGNFIIRNENNNYIMYESTSKSNGQNKVMTGSISNPDADLSAQWQVTITGYAYGTIPLYKIKNVESGKVLTVNVPSGDISDAQNGSTIITSPDFGSSETQEFMLDSD